MPFCHLRVYFHKDRPYLNIYCHRPWPGHHFFPCLQSCLHPATGVLVSQLSNNNNNNNKTFICNVCQFLIYKHSYHGQFPPPNNLTTSLQNLRIFDNWLSHASSAYHCLNTAHKAHNVADHFGARTQIMCLLRN